jgi:hypothetical protein
MAPEQMNITGDPNILGPACDIWALGVILYELLVGHRPFAGNTRHEICAQVLEGRWTPPTEANPSLDPTLGRIIEQCLRQNPSERYPSAKLLAEDLRKWLAGQRVPYRGPSPSTAFAKIIRHPLTLLLLFGVGSGLILLFAKMPPRQLESVNSALIAGESVALQDAEGKLLFGHVLVGEPTINTDAKEGATTLQGDRIVLVQVLPAVPVKNFRLEMEVMQHGNHAGTTGIFWSHNCTNENLRQVHRIATWTFNHWVPPPLELPNELKALHQFGLRKMELTGIEVPNEGFAGTCNKGLFENSYNPPRTLNDGFTYEWVSLALECNETTWIVEMGGKSIKALPIEAVGKYVSDLQRQLKMPENTEMELSSTRGLGLYLMGGSASFRRIRLVPQ